MFGSHIVGCVDTDNMMKELTVGKQDEYEIRFLAEITVVICETVGEVGSTAAGGNFLMLLGWIEMVI